MRIAGNGLLVNIFAELELPATSKQKHVMGAGEVTRLKTKGSYRHYFIIVVIHYLFSILH